MVIKDYTQVDLHYYQQLETYQTLYTNISRKKKLQIILNPTFCHCVRFEIK